MTIFQILIAYSRWFCVSAAYHPSTIITRDASVSELSGCISLTDRLKTLAVQRMVMLDGKGQKPRSELTYLAYTFALGQSRPQRLIVAAQYMRSRASGMLFAVSLYTAGSAAWPGGVPGWLSDEAPRPSSTFTGVLKQNGGQAQASSSGEPFGPGLISCNDATKFGLQFAIRPEYSNL